MIIQDSNITIWKPTFNIWHNSNQYSLLQREREKLCLGSVGMCNREYSFLHHRLTRLQACVIQARQQKAARASSLWPCANQNSAFWTAAILVYKAHSSDTSCCPGSTIEQRSSHVNISIIMFTVKAGPNGRRLIGLGFPPILQIDRNSKFKNVVLSKVERQYAEYDYHNPLACRSDQKALICPSTCFVWVLNDLEWYKTRPTILVQYSGHLSAAWHSYTLPLVLNEILCVYFWFI